MKTHPLRLLLPLLAALLLAGCVITEDVQPVAEGTVIPEIYILDNPEVLMDGFLPSLAEEVQDLGYATRIVDDPGQVPQGAYSLEYTANWSWDAAWTMSMYLAYFQAYLMRDGHEVGYVCYNATDGSQRIDKAGRTMDKLRPLLIELLAPASPAR